MPDWNIAYMEYWNTEVISPEKDLGRLGVVQIVGPCLSRGVFAFYVRSCPRLKKKTLYRQFIDSNKFIVNVSITRKHPLNFQTPLYVKG